MKKDSKKTHYILFNTLLAWLEKPSINRKITIFLIILSFFASIITYLVFSNSLPYIKTTPNKNAKKNKQRNITV